MSSSKDVPDTTGLITSEAILYKLAMKKMKKMKNGLLHIAAQCWIVHETLKH